MFPVWSIWATHLISIIEAVVHEPCDEWGLPDALLPQEHQFELPQRIAEISGGRHDCCWQWRQHTAGITWVTKSENSHTVSHHTLLPLASPSPDIAPSSCAQSPCIVEPRVKAWAAAAADPAVARHPALCSCVPGGPVAQPRHVEMLESWQQTGETSSVPASNYWDLHFAQE